ncbi:MAG: hypothetical protein EOO38_22965 [Cytophagaceae bacterium]|nr:MAG: hypothetical protein EOO38_22965 [Cytophagaceae bacterium]
MTNRPAMSGFGEESESSGLEATPQETDQRKDIPDASVFCITGTLTFLPFWADAKSANFASKQGSAAGKRS